MGVGEGPTVPSPKGRDIHPPVSHPVADSLHWPALPTGWWCVVFQVRCADGEVLVVISIANIIDGERS